MKKTFIPLFLGALMAGCAQNDPQPGQDSEIGTIIPGTEATAGEVSGYLTINIAPVNSGLQTRDGITSENDEPGIYENGLQEENQVDEIRFYFFCTKDGDTGAPAHVRKNPIYTEDGNNGPEYYSYYDWDPSASENGDYNNQTSGEGNSDSETVEKILTTMIVLTAEDNPESVVAIINPTNDIKQLAPEKGGNATLKQLQAQVGNYVTPALTQSGTFLMSNSVYMSTETADDNGASTQASGSPEIIVSQAIPEGKICLTQIEAQQNPLIVYVERVAAKLRTTLDIKYKEDSGLTVVNKNDVKLYPTGFNFTSMDKKYTDDTYEDDSQYTDVPVYVHFLGWAAVSTPVQSYLLKSISATWPGKYDLFGSEDQPWWSEAYHRSYWATNAPFEVNQSTSYLWYNYKEIAGLTTEQTVGCFKGESGTTYLQENANPNPAKQSGTEGAANPENPTAVVYAAQLVNADNEPIEIAEWNGIYFTLEGMQNYAAKMLEMYYNVNEGTDQPKEYKPITGKDITFITAREFEDGDAYNPATSPIFETGNYWVYATPLDSDTKWYHFSRDGSTTGTYTPITNPTTYMANVFGHAKIWKNGMTYFYYEINHLGDKNNENGTGYFGVVRNHIYNGTVQSLTGLGTPVWNEEEDIDPEKPLNDGSNISADVKILSWRLVTDLYDFDW